VTLSSQVEVAMSLSLELQKFPPQALDVLRYLSQQEEGASTEAIVQGTGLGDRAFGKAIRRLVTRHYVDMPSPEFYRLTESGKRAAKELGDYDTGPIATIPPVPATSTVIYHERRLSILITQELVIRTTAVLMAGFDMPGDGKAPLKQPGRVILRVSAPGCDVVPVERPLEVAIDRAVGPVQFRLTPRQEGTVRVKVEAYQLVTLQQIVPLGGMYFDIRVAGFPTPKSSEFQALGAVIKMHPGGES
jgi:hypothetical protein